MDLMKKRLVTAIVLTCMATLPYAAAAQDLADEQAKTYAQNSLNEADYTPEQWQQIQDSINALQKAISDVAESQIFDEVVPTSEEFTPNNQKLQDDVYSSCSLNEADYTPEQWQQIQDSITKSKDVLEIFDKGKPLIEENLSVPEPEIVNTYLEHHEKNKDMKLAAVVEDVSKSSAKQDKKVFVQDDDANKSIPELIIESQRLRNELNQYLKAENKAKLSKKSLPKKTVQQSPMTSITTEQPTDIYKLSKKAVSPHFQRKLAVTHTEDELNDYRTGAAVLKRTRHEKRPIEVVDPSDLNFNFSVKGRKFLPKYVWDDGHYTFLLFPQAAYKQDIYILACTNDNVQQLREYEIQDEFMKLPGTWSKLKFFIGKHSLMVENEDFIQ